MVRSVSEVSDDGVMGIDLDGDNIPDVSLAGMISGRPGMGWRDEQDKRRIALRNSRALAVMTMFRLYRLQRSPLCRFVPSWTLRNSSGISKGIDKPVVQGGRDFPYIRVGGGQ